MANDMRIAKSELVENPTARVPVCLCLDVSASMTGDAIKELNQGVHDFISSLQEDEIARYSAEVAVIVFCGSAAEILLDFGPINSQSLPQLKARGNTPMGDAVTQALDLLDRRKKEYSEAGIDYYQPWLVLMTDGKPTDKVEAAIRRTVALVEAKKLTLFPIGVGKNADMAALRRFSPKRTPLRLKGLKFREFFEWLSRSVSRVSQSIPGQAVPLDEQGIKGWSEL
jgi:uncharacterized protein YegL